MRRKITKLTAAEEEEGRHDTAGRDACEDDDMDMLLKIVNGKSHPQAHMDWIAMENYAQKYHEGSRFAKCISRSHGRRLGSKDGPDIGVKFGRQISPRSAYQT